MGKACERCTTQRCTCELKENKHADSCCELMINDIRNASSLLLTTSPPNANDSSLSIECSTSSCCEASFCDLMEHVEKTISKPDKKSVVEKKQNDKTRCCSTKLSKFVSSGSHPGCVSLDNSSRLSAEGAGMPSHTTYYRHRNIPFGCGHELKCNSRKTELRQLVGFGLESVPVYETDADDYSTLCIELVFRACILFVAEVADYVERQLFIGLLTPKSPTKKQPDSFNGSSIEGTSLNEPNNSSINDAESEGGSIGVSDEAAGTSDAATNDASDDFVNADPQDIPLQIPITNGSSSVRSDGGPSGGILKELTCPICLDIFNLPVTMACGHTFCRYCISHSKLRSCPLCRHSLGATLSVNTVLTNLIKTVGACRKTTTPIVAQPSEVLNTVDQDWWHENFIKPHVSVSLFLRIFLENMSISPVFFDDLTACVIDYFSKTNSWSKGKWVFTWQDCGLFCHLIRYNKDDLESSKERLDQWVERYIADSPSVCPPREIQSVMIRIYQDRIHRIDGQCFESTNIPNRLPWDAGRHMKSLISLPHSSVSLSHLLLVRTDSGGIGVVDCGSTIGTMIRVNNEHVLKSGEIIHIGDRLEAEVRITSRAPGSPFKGFTWCAKTKEVLGYTQSKTNSENGTKLARKSDDEGKTKNCNQSVDTTESGSIANVMNETDESLQPVQYSRRSQRREIARTLIPGESTAVAAWKQLISGRADNNYKEEDEDTFQSAASEEPNINQSVYSSNNCILDVYESDNALNQDNSEERESYQSKRSDGETTEDPKAEEIESQLHITISNGTQTEIDQWIDPRGMVLGRGPHAQSAYKKISVTAMNGYVSREHCLIYYDGSEAPGKRWKLRDISTLGTFLRLKPFAEPAPLPLGSLFKAGQCKVEICSPRRPSLNGMRPEENVQPGVYTNNNPGSIRPPFLVPHRVPDGNPYQTNRFPLVHPSSGLQLACYAHPGLRYIGGGDDQRHDEINTQSEQVNNNIPSLVQQLLLNDMLRHYRRSDNLGNRQPIVPGSDIPDAPQHVTDMNISNLDTNFNSLDESNSQPYFPREPFSHELDALDRSSVSEEENPASRDDQ